MASALTISDPFEKEAAETFSIDFDCTNSLPVGATSISSATVTATDDLTGLDASATVLVTTVATIIAPDNLIARIAVTGGTPETSYTLLLTATLNTGDVIRARTNMAVY